MPSILEGVFSSSEDELNKMLLSLVGMPKAEIEAELSIIKSRVEEVAQTIPTKGNKGDKGDKGDQGIQGPKGEPGREGRDGYQGKDGKQGVDGKDGIDGANGVSIVDVNVAFDNHLVITLSDGTEIDAGVIGDLNANLQNVVANYVSKGANGTLIYKGLWNASTNTPTLSLLSSDASAYYVVSVAGNTNLSGITDWQVNDWIIFNGTEWQKIDNSDLFNASAVAITGGAIDGTTIGSTTATTGRFTSVTTPSVTATTNDLTLSAISTGAVKFNTLNGTGMTVVNPASTVANYWEVAPAVSGVGIGLYARGTDASIAMNYLSKGSFGHFFSTGGTYMPQAVVSHTASAVNYVQVTGAATGGGVTVSAQGSDSNIPFNYRTKGIFNHNFQTGTGGTTFVVNQTNGSANYNETASSATGFATTFKSLGTDTNISMAFQPKGTGAINLAAGSSGVNISNGGTVTAITRTNTGSGYSTMPTVVISAPTTAGGVQATVGTITVFASGVTIANGGTGYTVGNTLTVVGGTPTTATQLTVTTVSSGVITGVSIVANTGGYTALPTNPASVTGGSGSGATFNFTYGINTLAISNAGSGYIEQPTITFSGGGGSGAAAYASVGGGSVVRALGTTFNLNNSAGTCAQISNTGTGTSVNFPVLLGAPAGSGPTIDFNGSDANVVGLFTSKGASSAIGFAPNYAIQLRVPATASAVNFVQVTGNTTTNNPTISAQGSDTNPSLWLTAKGSGQVVSRSWFTAAQASANYWQMAGAGAGSSPVLSVLGSDTNIDLALTPKGTGRVKFGTHTATADTAVSGYIEIVDAGGTVRKLAVIT
jgi:hypothetical protein